MAHPHQGVLEQEHWLQEVSSHPIFADAPPSSVHPPHPASSNVFVVINQTDLIVAAGSELRFLSLAKFKASLSAQNGRPISYQVLHPNPSSTMPVGPITHLIANPKPRLLAVCSSNHVSVLSLPRPEEQSDPTSINCCVTSVGPTTSTHSVGEEGETEVNPHLPRIMKVLWHASSHHSSILLILYASGIIHEYDVSRDTKNPAQIIDFNSSSPIPADETGHTSKLTTFENQDDTFTNSIKSRANSTLLRSFKTSTPQNKYHRTSASRQTPTSKRNTLQTSSRPGTYGPTDSASMTAVSMCFGTGTGDWGPLTLYCIMQNGDIYALCPYLPKNAVIPLSYRNSLLFFLTAKLESISTSAADPSLLVELQTRLYQSLDYLNSWHDVPDLGLDDDFELDNPDGNRPVGHASHLRPLRQGPFLMVPSPIENNENIEETISDLAQFRYPYATSVKKKLKKLTTEPESNSDSVGVFLIAYQSRIDVCLEVEKIEPRWVPPDKDTSTTTSVNSELPMLITYESIDLGITHGLIEPSDLENNNLNMVFDVRYNDTIYVYHRMGLHAISTLKWLQSLTQNLSKSHDSEVYERLAKAIGEKIGSEVVWIVRTTGSNAKTGMLLNAEPSISSLCVIDDAYLGYVVLAITSDAHLISLPLQHRPLALQTSATPHATFGSTNVASLQIPNQPFIPKSLSHPSYVGFIKEQWEVPSLLNEKASQILSAKLKPPLDPTVSTILKYAGKASAEINQYIRRVIEAVNSGQDRLKLLINEYNRQLDQVFRAPEKLDGEKAQSITQVHIERIHRIAENQTKLLQRADQLLQRLTDDRNRSLSKEESKWFAELNRMKSEVLGEVDRKGLLNEIEQLKNQLDKTKSNIMNDLKRTRESQTETTTSSSRSSKLSFATSSATDSYYFQPSKSIRKDSSSLLVSNYNTNTNKLGESQIIPIYHKLAQANSCIVIIKDQITKINSILAKK